MDNQAAETWDDLVSRSVKEALQPSRLKRGLAPLKLRADAEPKHLPNVRRSIAMIDSELRSLFRTLVSGAAPWPLFLFGKAGLGKTCAALCLLDHATLGEYFTEADFVDDAIRCKLGKLDAPRGADYRFVAHADFWRWRSNAALTVLDEFGARDRVSDAHYEAVKRLIDTRADRPLVVVSNLEPARIGDIYDERILSRLGAGTLFELRGGDRRLAE